MTESYDKKAELFLKDTSIWPLGKDSPRGHIPDTEYTVREKAYKYWLKMQVINKPITEHPDVQRLISQMVVLKASHDKLVEALEKYGKHSQECRDEKYPEAWHCICGLEQAKEIT